MGKLGPGTPYSLCWGMNERIYVLRQLHFYCGIRLVMAVLQGWQWARVWPPSDFEAIKRWKERGRSPLNKTDGE